MRVIYCSTFGLRSFLAVSAPLLRNTNPSAPTKQCRLDDFFRSSFLFLGAERIARQGWIPSLFLREYALMQASAGDARLLRSETTGRRDHGTTRPRDCETTRRRGYTSAKNAGIARNIPKSRSPLKNTAFLSHSQAFSAIPSRSHPSPAARGNLYHSAADVALSQKIKNFFVYLYVIYSYMKR